MKVYYPGPGWRTFHPELGELLKDKPFKLDDKIARKYVKSGLLKEHKEKVPRGSSPDHTKYEK